MIAFYNNCVDRLCENGVADRDLYHIVLEQMMVVRTRDGDP